ncbi:MAG TPA: signal peptidase II [Trueperaceae bacterium]|nr:signal peptidase II [Trueperaceae bacterium]
MTFLLAAVLVVADQLSKAWVGRNLQLNQTDIAVFPGFGITHTRNNGAAFGMLRDVDFMVLGIHVDGTVLLGLLSAAVSIALIGYLVAQRRHLAVLQQVALGLVLAGAIGNMIDRLRLGYVVDFLHLRSGGFSFPVFNIADACVVVGAVLLVLSGLRGPSRGVNEEEARDTVPYDTSEDDEPATYSARPSPAHVPTARERKRPLDDYPDLPPLGRAQEVD